MRWNKDDNLVKRNWTFKAGPPLGEDARKLVGDQMHAAHHFANKLIELELKRRQDTDTAIIARYPRVGQLDKAIEMAVQALTGERHKVELRNQVERRRTGTEDDRARIRAMEKSLAELKRERKRLRAEAFADPVLRPTLDAFDAEYKASFTREYNDPSWGLGPGTREPIRAARGNDRKGTPPDFRHWNGDGTIGVQIVQDQKRGRTLDWAGAFLGLSNHLRIVVKTLDERPRQVVKKDGRIVDLPVADPMSKRSIRRQRAVAWLRVGSDGPSKQPVWVRVPFNLDRLPPPAAIVRRAFLHRRRVGVKDTWWIRFVLAHESWEREDVARSGACGLDLRWRLLPEGLHIGCAIGDDGHREECVIPCDWIARWRKVEDLRSIRDRNFDAIRAELAEWLESYRRLASTWLKGELQTMHTWKSPETLAKIVTAWRKEHRFRGDERIFARAEAWRKQERHLHDWEDMQRKKIIRRRNDHYRRFARRLACMYGTVTILNVDWRHLREKEQAEERDARDQAKFYANIASVGRLTQFVKEAVAEVRKAPVSTPVKQCHQCGHRDQYDEAVEWDHTCSRCGSTWTLAENKARNLLEWEGGGTEDEGASEGDREDAA